MAAGTIALNMIMRTQQFSNDIRRTRQQVTSLETRFKNFSKTLLGLAGISGGLYAFQRGLKAIYSAAMIQEKAENDLRAALLNMGDNYKDLLPTMKAFAAELQRQTIYGDELILSQMAYARNLGITADKLDEAATAAIGLAAKYRLELQTAMMLIGRAFNGQTTALTRYGIILDDTLSDQEKFNQLLKIGAQSFDLARAETQTLSGQVKQLGNTWGDLKEEMADTELAKNSISTLKQTLLGVADAYGSIKQAIEEVNKGQQSLIEQTIEGRKKIFQLQSDTKATEKEIPILGEKGSIYSRGFGPIDIEAEAAKAKLSENLNRPYMSRYDIARPAQSKMRRNELAWGKLEEYWKKQEEAKKAAEEIGRKWQELSWTMEFSMTNAFDQMIFEGAKFKDVMKQLARDILREWVRIFVFRQAASTATSWMRSTFNLPVQGTRQSGGYIPRTGLYQLHAGEFVENEHNVRTGGGESPIVNITNNGPAMDWNVSSRVQNGQKILDIVANGMTNYGPLKRGVRQAARTR